MVSDNDLPKQSTRITSLQKVAAETPDTWAQAAGVCSVGEPGGQMNLPVLLGGPIITIHSDCQHSLQGYVLTLPSAASVVIQIHQKKNIFPVQFLLSMCPHCCLQTSVLGWQKPKQMWSSTSMFNVLGIPRCYSGDHTWEEGLAELA